LIETYFDFKFGESRPLCLVLNYCVVYYMTEDSESKISLSLVG